MLDWVRSNGSSSQQRFTWLIEAFVDEALEEMSLGTPEQVASVFGKMGELLNWIATGEDTGLFQQQLAGNVEQSKELESAPAS